MKKSLSLILLSFLFITSFAVLVSAADDSTFLSEAVPWSETFLNQLFNLGQTWKEFIIGLIILAIMIAALYDILVLTSIFEGNAVKIIISVGLGLVFAITGMVKGFSIWMISFAAGLGAFAIWVEIIIALVMFIGLSIGSTFIAKWAAKRQANAAMVKAVKAAGKTSAGANFLQDLYENSIKKSK